jgi:hypothetical protein
LLDTSSQPIAGQTIVFTIGTETRSGTTDAKGHASATITLVGPAGAPGLSAAFEGVDPYGPSSASGGFAVQKEDTILSMMTDAVASRNIPAPVSATLKEVDGLLLEGKTIEFQVQKKVKGVATWATIATAITNAQGVATGSIPSRYVSVQKETIRAFFSGDVSFIAAEASGLMYRQ